MLLTQRPLPAQGSLRHSLSSEQREVGREVREAFLWAPASNLLMLRAGPGMALCDKEGMRKQKGPERWIISNAGSHEVSTFGPLRHQGREGSCPTLPPCHAAPSASGPVITSFLLQGTVDISPLYDNTGWA